MEGFQAGQFQLGNRKVVVFRGTHEGQRGDLIADGALAAGMNTSYYTQAEGFLAECGSGDFLLCGHSLGGAIAQVLANRTGHPMVTFNAPGVAVLASRNIGQASAPFLAARVAGMVASAVYDPAQALEDAKAAFNVVKGINLCLFGDPISQYGIHYGEVRRLPAWGHGIGKMIAVLEGMSLGFQEVPY